VHAALSARANNNPVHLCSQSRGLQPSQHRSASRLTTLATLGYDQQVGLDGIIPESYNKVGVSSRTAVEVVSLFPHIGVIVLTT
jgi:hypothetical protein